MPLEIFRLHLASLQGIEGRRWPVHGFVVSHPGGAVLVDTGVGGAFGLLISDAAYTPQVYADPDLSTSDRLPAGQASDFPVWCDSVRRIRSLRPERVHSCHHTDVVHR